MRKKKPKVSHERMNKRLNDFIQSFVKDFEDEEVSMNKIDTATRTFVESLTPLERGMLLHEDAAHIEIVSDYDHYINKYGEEYLKKGCFFRLPSGAISFISHEHNLKYKVEN